MSRLRQGSIAKSSDDDICYLLRVVPYLADIQYLTVKSNCHSIKCEIVFLRSRYNVVEFVVRTDDTKMY